MCNHEVSLTADALRTRTRRLCERKSSGRYNIDAETAEQYKSAGPQREMLEMALLECLAKFGTDRKHYKKVKVRWLEKGSSNVYTNPSCTNNCWYG